MTRGTKLLVGRLAPHTCAALGLALCYAWALTLSRPPALATAAPPGQGPGPERPVNLIVRPPAPSVALEGITHMWQRWSNCGPATLAMQLSYFGIARTQFDVAQVVKPDPEDKNVTPEELAAYARSQGLHAIVRVNGDSERMRLLLSNGVPVLIETWYERGPEDSMGHYRLLSGYDDASQEWIAFDSFVMEGVSDKLPYKGIRLPYGKMERLWWVFNRSYVLVYPGEWEPLVLAILGDDADDARMWQRALEQAQAAVEANPKDAFAWFNLGSDLVALGRFTEAAAAYDQARAIGLPWRMAWYQFGPYQAYFETGRYADLIALADQTIAAAGNIEEAFYWKGMGLAAQGDPIGARQAWERTLQLNPNYRLAAAALASLG
jgi:tetratricopeptide (TPR) repeat protein